MKRLLVVVDYQYDFVAGSLGFEAARQLEEPICQKIREYEARGDEVVFTFDTHGENYPDTQEGRRLPVMHCLKGSPGWQLYGKVAQYYDATTPAFVKTAFGSIELAGYLRQQQYDQVELVGLVSNICVLSNAILAKAALPEAEIVVDARCTACADPQVHEKALDILEGVQVTVSHRNER